MKRTFLFIMLFSFMACKHKEETKVEQLTRLKKERMDLDKKIADLEAHGGDTTKRKAIPVSVLELSPATFNAFIEVQASVKGDADVNATPQVPGTIRSVLVRPGQRVSQGQTLATIDASPLDQQIGAQDANIVFLKGLYEKQQTLWAQNIGTEVQLMQAKANYESAVKGRSATIAQRNMYRIVAPISGVVDAVNVTAGDVASPGNPMAGIHIVSNSRLKVTASLGENYLGKVQSDNPVTLVFPDINDSIQTRLSYVSQAVDPVSRTFGVEVRIGSNSKLHPNMSCQMRIANYAASNALTVPTNAIQRTSEGDVVYVAQGSVAKAVRVQTGRSSNGLIEILAGLKTGDRVIVEGYQELDNGSPISIQN